MTRPRPHRCNPRCVCPVHQTRLRYFPVLDDHTCQQADCVYAQTMSPPTTWVCTNQIMVTPMIVEGEDGPRITDPVERAKHRYQRECGYTVEVAYPPDLPLNRDRHLADCPAVTP